MKIKKSAKNVLLSYAFDNYGQILREIGDMDLSKMSKEELIQGKEVLTKINKILGKYSSELIREYEVIIMCLNGPYFDYSLHLKKK